MKTKSVLAAAVALSGICAAIPAPVVVRADGPDSRQLTIVDPAVSAATQVPQVIVYVDDKGAMLKTTTEVIMIVPHTRSADAEAPLTLNAESAPGPTAASIVGNDNDDSSSNNNNNNHPELGPAPAPSQVASGPQLLPEQAPSPTTSSPSSPSSSPSPLSIPAASPVGSSSAGLPGIAYAPYNSDQSCKTADEVAADVATFGGVYSFVRLYGVDCDQISKVYGPAKQANVRLFVGLFSLDGLEDQISTLVQSPVGRDWDAVHTVSVGNERVNNGQASVGQVLDAIAKARQLLRAAGYQGPVITVDTFVAVGQHPELCDQSDYCAVNAHAFFDGTVRPEQAGAWLVDTVQGVRDRLADPGKRVVVSETGWPTQGTSNGVASPSLANQAAALGSIRARFGSGLSAGDVVFFSAFNDMWKKAEPWTYNAEQFWGIGGGYSHGDGR